MAGHPHGLKITLLDSVTASHEAVLDRLRSTRAGLSNEEAAARLRRHGLNQLPKQAGPSLARKLLDQMIHFFALMLWAAAALCFAGEMPQLGVAIIVVIVVNGIFSFVQEYRAERAAQALAALVPDTATVRRAGRKRSIPASELVPGDILLLKEGDRISADARVLRSSELKIDLSTLTGESEPVLRTAAVQATTPADALEAGNVVFAGAFVTSGSATALVIATGPETRLGGISRLTGQIAERPTPLRQQLNGSVRLIAALAVVTGLVFFGVSYSLGTPIHESLLFSIGVIVALVPRGIAADTVTVAGHERHSYGQTRRAGAAAGVGGNPRLDHGDLHRQDRHRHSKRDDRPGSGASGVPVPHDRFGVRTGRDDPDRRRTAPERCRMRGTAPIAAGRRVMRRHPH
jgi:magnesium-transporting ATPase (P-type)